MKRYTFFFMILLISISFCIYGQEVVKVGGYTFPPYLVKTDSGYGGLTIELIEAMNSYQNQFDFQFVETTSKRRYDHFEKGRFHLIMFEDLNWGWSDRDVSYSDIYLEDGEVYISKYSPEKDQLYFHDLEGKSIAVILGYHYSFADFNSDEEYLSEHFDIQFSRDHNINIRKVLEGIADISLVTQSFLYRFIQDNDIGDNQLLISEKLDHKYSHRIIITDESPISVSEVNKLLEEMEKAGILLQLWKRYGLQ